MPDRTPEQDALRAEVAKFTASEITPNATRWDVEHADGAYPMHLFTRLGELGWLGIGFDEALGGSGGGPVERCILFEELAYGSAGAALGLYVHTALAAGALATVADPELAGRFVPDLLAGTTTGAWAYAEPDSGADVTRVRLDACRDGDHFVLNG